MAELANAVTTVASATAGNIKEDIGDRIYNISPLDQVLTNLIGNGVAYSTKHSL